MNAFNNTGMSQDLTALVISSEGQTRLEKPVANEHPLTIIFNGQELATLLCSPDSLEELTAGFLSSEGFLANREEIKSLRIDLERGIARPETIQDKEVPREVLYKRLISTGCGRGAAFYSALDSADTQVASLTTLAAAEIISLTQTFQHASNTYQTTHGVHSAALYGGTNILLHAEDIGRHNAIDKVFGQALLKGIAIEGCTIITSGRITSEIAHKAAKKGIPIIISISAPTTLAVQAAGRLGITLVALVRGGKLSVFSHEERII